MKTLKKTIAVVLTFIVAVSVVGCVRFESKKASAFTYWNDCEALTAIQDFVETATDRNSDGYIPVEDRIAVFDMDGTLCGELFPEYIEYLLLAYRCLDDENYEASDELKEVATLIREAGKNYKTPAVSGFDLIHGRAQAKAFAGLTSDEFIAYVKNFLELPAQGFEGLTYAESLYKPMIEVVAYLHENDFQVYVVSGSDRMICRAVACEKLNIPENRVIGMEVMMEASNQGDSDNLDYQFNDGGEDVLVRGDELWLKNLKMNKVFRIAQEIGKKPVLSFGNSSGDVSMHEYTITDNKYNAMAFMLVADDAERDHADLNETAKRLADWQKRGYTVISMKDDFKTIYGYDVVMTA